MTSSIETINSAGSLLIADDDSDDLEFMTEALARNGFAGQVRSVANGRHLLDTLRSDVVHGALPDLILLDLNMPLLNGYEVLEELQRHTLFRTIAVVILTSSTRPMDEALCYGLGCRGYYTKPCTLREFDMLAQEILSTYL